MQSAATPSPSQPAATFAGLLAALASPNRRAVHDGPDDDPAEDVATLSYEQALRAHARYKPADPDESSLPWAGQTGSIRIHEVDIAGPAPATQQCAAPENDLETADEIEPSVEAAEDKSLRCRSVTIRLSQDESVQLRKRAAEAGLTVSAYLRSCTFEAESLRAMVKDALAQLRTEPPKKPVGNVSLPGLWRWLIWFRPGARISTRPAQSAVRA